MNALIINCSPVRTGATAEIAGIVAGQLSAGYNVKSICIDDYSFAFCKGCRSCHNTAKCVMDDAGVIGDIMKEYDNADIIVSVSPSYWADIPGQFKAFIDRCTPWCNTHEPHAAIKPGKKGYVIALRTGPGMPECERIISSIEHFYGHLEIERMGHLGLTAIEYKEDVEPRKSEIIDFCSKIPALNLNNKLCAVQTPCFHDRSRKTAHFKRRSPYMSELWDVYTIDRRPTGKTCVRGEQKHLADDEFHLWVMVWIKNKETGKYLVSQRSADKDTDPLKWETVAGHAVTGETSLEAAVREVYEEVGIKLDPGDAKILATKVAKTYDGRRHNWIRDSYYFETDENPDLNKATTKEVIQTKWLSFAEIKEMYERGECCLNMGDLYGFELNPVPADQYRDIIGQVVKGEIDRPLGSSHPRHKEMIYPVNYGYVTDVIGGDGHPQDIYLLCEDSPVETFCGKVVAVYHRYDDNETKWLVVPCDENGNIRNGITIPGKDEIYALLAFQEQFFSGVLVGVRENDEGV